MPLEFTAAAISDLVGIEQYYKQFNPAAASKLAACPIEACRGLEVQPRRGMVTGKGRRRLTTVWPYVIQYRIGEAMDAVVILRVRHGARRPLKRR